jgi:hypothetical protein
MSYRLDNENQSGNKSIVIDGWEKGIASSPYTGIANIRNLATAWYPSVAYVNYKRLGTTLSDGHFYAGIHSINVSNNFGWIFNIPATMSMGNPVAKATSPAGLNYVLDANGNVFKQNSINSSTFSIIENGGGRVGNGAGGLGYWYNYLVVFGDGMIEFCGNGTGDSGVNSSNWNIISPLATTTVQVQSTLRLFSTSFTGMLSSGATSGTLASVWTGVSGTYTAQFTTGTPTLDVRNITFTNGSASVSWTTGLTQNTTTPAQIDMYQMSAVANTFSGYNNFNASTNTPVTFSSTGTLPTGITAGTTYYLLSSVDYVNQGTFTFSATPGGNFIALTDTGSGTITMSFPPANVPPINNTTITGFSWVSNTGSIVSGNGATALTLTSPWLGVSGTYLITDPSGNQFFGIFVYDSVTVVLATPATYQAPSSGTFLVQIVNPSNAIYKTWNSKVDGNLYFTNGHFIGRLVTAGASIPIFIPSIPQTYFVAYGVIAVAEVGDIAIDMTDLRGQMIIAGNFDTYVWDYQSTAVFAPNPVGEQITGLINVLNNVYIFAGQKGNIYVSNGASAQVLYKLPDNIAGNIDPIWSYGGYMFHRGKLYFQATASNTSVTNILAGVFSLNVSATLVTDVETSGALVMEAQNSYGLTPASGSSPIGVLMDNEPSSNGQDSYYSAWSNGSNVGGIDYNSTTLWQNNEPIIETDIIPIGTILSKQSFGRIEYKLDRPLAVGDSITMYWRPSLTDSYVQIGTGTTATSNYLPLSADFPSNITQAQWAQFKITFSCASSGSSFIPLREVRLHYGNQ